MRRPPTTVTIAFTAFFVVLRENPAGAGMIAGVLPATAGLAFAVAYRFARAEVAGERRCPAVTILALAGSSFVLMGLLRVSSVVTVIGAGILAIFLFRAEEGPDGSP
jgi:chromate transport protein ChrA